MKLGEAFKAGDPVPEWLLSVAPTSPTSVPGSFTFTHDCHVIEVDGGVVVLKDRMSDICDSINGAHVMTLNGASDLIISAGGVCAALATVFYVFTPVGEK